MENLVVLFFEPWGLDEVGCRRLNNNLQRACSVLKQKTFNRLIWQISY